MPKGGLALYRNKALKKFFAFRVLYEYADTKFVGFDPNYAYRIDSADAFLGRLFNQFSYTNPKDGITRHYSYDKMTPEQKEWLKNGGYKKFYPNMKSTRLVGDYVIYPVDMQPPKGTLYTQMPGGGGVFKITRNIKDISELLKNPSVIKALDKWGADVINEDFARKVVRSVINESSNVAYTGVVIEDPKYIKKLDDIVTICDEDNIENIGFTNLKNIGKIEQSICLPFGWEKPDDYHITIKLGELPLSRKRDLNKPVEDIKVVLIGVSSMAVALGVEMPYISKNELAHITLAYNAAEGGAPKDSNDIETWRPLKNPFVISGIIREVPKTFIDEEDKTYFKSGCITQPVTPGFANKFPKEKEEEY